MLTIFVKCRVRINIWNHQYWKGPDYLIGRIMFETKFGLNNWVTAVAGQVEVRSSVF